MVLPLELICPPPVEVNPPSIILVTAPDSVASLAVVLDPKL